MSEKESNALNIQEQKVRDWRKIIRRGALAVAVTGFGVASYGMNVAVNRDFATQESMKEDGYERQDPRKIEAAEALIKFHKTCQAITAGELGRAKEIKNRWDVYEAEFQRRDPVNNIGLILWGVGMAASVIGGIVYTENSGKKI